jgi:methylmalonyl-CoA mutase
MGESVIQKILQASFPIPNSEVWEKSATSELDGNDPFIKLAWDDPDGIKFSPYYTKEDISSIRYLNAFHFTPSENSFLGNRAWYNMPCITVMDEVTSNKKALSHLSNGADGILFNLEKNPSPDLIKLLQSIEWQYCALSFYHAKDDKFISSLNNYFTEKNIDRAAVAGNIFWETLPENRNNFTFSAFENFKTLGCIITSSTPVKEIHQALCSAVIFLDSINDQKSFELSFKKISFSVAVDQNFLLNICKLKALRLLWYQVSQAYGVENFAPEDLVIHATSHSWKHDKFQPHGNMLNSTTAAMAAIIGGCNSLSVHPENESDATMDRIAKNVSNILREESHLDKVSDPTAGAYAIEVMVDSIAKEAWSMFQRTMKK